MTPKPLHLPNRHFPANRPSSAVDLTDLGTPPMHTISLDDEDSLSLAREPSNGQTNGNGHADKANGSGGNGSRNGEGSVAEHGIGQDSLVGSELDAGHVDDEEGPIFEDDVMEAGEGDLGVLLRTIDFAAKKHSCQRRKDVDQTPYINHPIAVANFLSSTGITDVRVLQAAVLHDTVEDTHTTIEELERFFGKDVARIVKECTDDTSLSGQARKTEQVRTAPYKSRQAQQVKLADKLHNLESIRRSPPVGWGIRRIQAYFTWAKQVTDECADSHPQLAARLQHLYETAYTRVNGVYHPCHPAVCGPLTEGEKARIDSRLNCLKAGEVPSPKPIFF